MGEESESRIFHDGEYTDMKLREEIFNSYGIKMKRVFVIDSIDDDTSLEDRLKNLFNEIADE
jgi:hypothetical protein